ncbi:MAG: hypothetical protein IPI01_05005 [Ignavibacteriae bacterium]|nr:hypothetical protein [Ignavibacteriota bacterium]
MRLRFDKRQPTDDEEEALQRALQAEVADDLPSPAPPAAYWQNLPVRVNAAIDDATSGRALSLSWAARVAIPGIVAVLSFLIGLYYYAPDRGGMVRSFRDVAMAMPPSAVDSLYVASLASGDTAFVGGLETDLLRLPSDLAREYYVENGSTSTLVEDLSDQEVREVLAVLSSNIK